MPRAYLPGDHFAADYFPPDYFPAGGDAAGGESTSGEVARDPNVTYAGRGCAPLRPGHVQRIMVRLTPNTTLAAGTLLGEVAATPGTFRAYAAGRVDGSEVPRAVLEYATTADAAGRLAVAVGREWGALQEYAPAFAAGVFLTDELTGLDEHAVPLAGRLVQGTVRAGVFRLGALSH